MDHRHPPARLRALPDPEAARGARTAPAVPRSAAASGSGAFCARCGQPPRTPGPHARVCAHCGLGLVLVAAAGAAPRPSDRFVVVDGRLMVSAVSLSAEALLGLGQDAALGRAVIDLVRPQSDESLVRNDFVASLRAATRGIGPLRRFDGLAGGEPLSVRVAPCGPPPGALLVLGGAGG